MKLLVRKNRFLVSVNDAVKNQRAFRAVISTTLRNISEVDGTLYAIDRKTGKLAWQKELLAQSILKGHSSNLPIIVTVGQKVEQPDAAAGAQLPGRAFVGIRSYLVKVLDIRDGNQLVVGEDVGRSISQLVVSEEEPAGKIVNCLRIESDHRSVRTESSTRS